MAQFEINSDGSAVIPPSTTRIQPMAFEDCAGLTSVTIPGSVTSIGGLAFEGCTGLKSVTFIEPVGIIEDFAFDNCVNLERITVPAGCKEAFVEQLGKEFEPLIVEA